MQRLLQLVMQLPARSQQLAAGIAAAVLVVAGLGTSWQMHRRAAAAEAELAAAVADKRVMEALVQRFQQRQASGGTAMDLSAVLTRSLQGKSFQPSRIQQQNGELALRVDNAPFNEVVTWMRELEAAGGVMLSNVSISQAQPAGATVTLVLRGG